MPKALKIQADLCTRPLLGKIIKFALPLIATGVLQLLYNAADIIVVGKYEGKEALAAVGSNGALINLLINLFIGLSVGTLASVARNIGSKNDAKVEKLAHTSIVISAISGVLLAIFGFFMAEKFLILMSTPSNILKLSALYLKIFFLGMPFNLLYNFGASILRATGDTRRPLVILTLSGLVNVGLNLLFVIKFKMGVAGVAWSTIIAQALSAILILVILFTKLGYGRLYWSKLKVDSGALLDILKIGVPAGIQGIVFSFSNVVIQSSINNMGDIAMAGNATAASIEGFVYVAMNSVSQATLTFVGQNYGANKKSNINLVIVQTVAITTVIGLVMGVGVYLLGTPIMSLYNSDPLVIASGLERLAVIGCTYFLCGIMEVLVGALRGVGKSVGPMIVSIVGVVGVRIVWVLLVYNYMQQPIWLYISYPVSWLITATIHLGYLIVVKKKLFAQMPDENNSAVVTAINSADNINNI